MVAKHVQSPAFFRDFRGEKKHKAGAQGEWTHRAGGEERRGGVARWCSQENPSQENPSQGIGLRIVVISIADERAAGMHTFSTQKSNLLTVDMRQRATAERRASTASSPVVSFRNWG